MYIKIKQLPRLHNHHKAPVLFCRIREKKKIIKVYKQ